MLWGCVCVCVCVCVFSHVLSRVQLFVTPWTVAPPSSFVHEILQAWILAWIAISSSSGPSRPRDQTHFSCISCTAGGFLTTSTELGLSLESVDPPQGAPVAKTQARWSHEYMGARFQSLVRELRSHKCDVWPKTLTESWTNDHLK